MSDACCTDGPGREKTRRPAVAGLFYPQDPAELYHQVRTLLDQAPADGDAPKALIVPHAGYVYSGAVAARAYATLAPVRQRIKRVVLLGPAHREYVRGLALSEAGHFASPLGSVEVDMDAVNRILDLPQVGVHESAHALEHSLEVHLPFLQLSLDGFKLVPLVVGDASTGEVAEVLDMLWGGEETLVVISSDLSHFHDYETASRIDRETVDNILELELEAVGPHEACGCMPIHGLLKIARDRHLRIENLDLCNSGDTAGTPERVVGYASFSVFPD